MDAVSQEVARREISRWLDYKQVGERKRIEREDQIDALVGAVQDGVLSVTDDNYLVQQLKFPIEGVDELKYKPRLATRDLKKRLEQVKTGDADGRVQAHVCELTGQSSGIIGLLDTEDYSISQNIAIFFF